MFEQVWLETDLGKTKSMTCTPDFIWGKMMKEAYKRWAMGEGTTFRNGSGQG